MMGERPPNERSRPTTIHLDEDEYWNAEDVEELNKIENQQFNPQTLDGEANHTGENEDMVDDPNPKTTITTTTTTTEQSTTEPKTATEQSKTATDQSITGTTSTTEQATTEQSTTTTATATTTTTEQATNDYVPLSMEELSLKYPSIIEYNIFQLAGDDHNSRPVIAFSMSRLPPREEIDHDELLLFMMQMLDR